MAARRPTAAQLRERRARIAAVVLTVVFLGVCAIQVPRVLHTLHDGDAVTVAPTVTTAAPSVLLSATPPAQPHVRRFSAFTPKDPFAPLVHDAAAAPAEPTTTTTAHATKPAPPAAPKPETTPPSASVATPPATTVPFAPTTKAATRPGVLLLVRGTKRALLRGDLFPVANPLFRVAGFTKHVLRLQLLTGTLPGGVSVLRLRPGHRIVLRNTTDGTSLALEYLRVAQVVPRTAPARPAR
jgi:hypothetical protein